MSVTSTELEKFRQKTIEILKRGWCKRNLAIDKSGHDCASESPGAVSWCVLGATDRAEFELQCNPDIGLTFRVRLRKRVETISHWNDDSPNLGAIIQELESLDLL